MGMYTPSMLLFWLGDSVTGFHAGYDRPVFPGGIKLLESGDEPLCAHCLYIGEEQTLKNVLSNGLLPNESILIIVSCAPDAFDPETLPPQLTLIQSSLPLISLYNTVHTHVHAFWDWDKALHEAVYKGAGPQAILNAATAKIDATILLLNPGYKHIASVYAPGIHDPSAEELRQNGYLSFDTIQALRKQPALVKIPEQEYVEFIPSFSGNYNIIQLISYQGNLAARLCVILNGPKANPAYADMSRLVAEYIAESMFSSQGIDYSGNTDFGSLISDLIECRLTEPEELKQRLKQFSMDVRYSYHVVIVSFNEVNRSTPIPWNYVINLLQAIFPYSSATVYRGDIFLLVRKTKRPSRVPFNREQLLNILEQYNCYIGIGNASDYISSLPPVYYQTKACIRIGQTMDPEKRIYYYEDYSMYHIIELASEAARTSISSRNLLHLCNNEIVALVKYDRKNHTDLVDILYAYLTHGCSATEAAKALYIHRNTILYKLKKIRSVIGCPLDDPMLQARLLFSYHVLDYCKRYLGIDPLELKRIRPEDRPTPDRS